jgi:hypothetical protein
MTPPPGRADVTARQNSARDARPQPAKRASMIGPPTLPSWALCNAGSVPPICNRVGSATPRSTRASAQLNPEGAAIEPCRFVSSRGHVTELQTRSATGRSLNVEASFAFE